MHLLFRGGEGVRITLYFRFFADIYVPSESENTRPFVASMTCFFNHLRLLDFLHASLLHATSVLEDGFKQQQGKIRASSNVAALKQVAVDAISAMKKPSIYKTQKHSL